MNAQEHITKIYEEKAKNDRNSSTLANTLETLIHTAFQGNPVFELLQNADDAEANHIEITYIPEIPDISSAYLIFAHSGKHFNEIDVEKICDNAQKKHVDKSQNENKTGYKGIGFKSIYKTSDKVIINSNEYCFRFDKTHALWKDQPEDQQYPWPIIPLWTEAKDIEPQLQVFLRNETVNFIIQIKKEANIIHELTAISENPTLILFLRSVKSIKITIGAHQSTEIQIKKEEKQYKLYKNSLLISEWLIQRYHFKITPETRLTLSNLSDHECPPRLKTAEQSSLIFAAQIQNGKIIRLNNAILFSFLPTQTISGLPFLVNADFLLNADRTALLENEWNKLLCRCIGKTQIKWIESLAKNAPLKTQALKLLNPSFNTYLKQTQQMAYWNSYQENLKETAFIPSYANSDQLLKINEALIDETGFYKLFKLALPSSEKKQIIDYSLENTELLYKSGADALNLNGLWVHFSSHVKNNPTLEFQKKLLDFIKAKLAHHSGLILNSPFQILSGVSFLSSDANEILKPNQLYVRPEGEINTPSILSFNFIHPGLLTYVQVLNNLGVKALNEKEVIQKITDLVRSHVASINSSNIIEISAYLLKAAQKNLISPEQWKIFKGLPILNNKNSLIPSFKSYLSGEYGPKINLQAINPEKDIYTSPRYLEIPHITAQEWGTFFNQMGVHSDIILEVKNYYSLAEGREELGIFFENYLNYLYSQGMTSQTKPLPNSHQINHFLYCNIFEYITAGSLELIQIFWEKLIENLPFLLRYNESTYRMNNGQTRSINISYIFYYLRTLPCAPSLDNTRQPTQSLYSPLFTELAAFLPVTSLAMSTEQALYFGFKTSLSLETCISLLKQFKKENINLYPIVFKEILKLDGEQKNCFKKLDIKLPAQDGSLQNRAQLRFLDMHGQTAPANSSNFIRELSEMSLQEQRELSHIFGLTIVKKADLKVNQAVRDDTIKILLKEKLSIIARIESHSIHLNETQILLNLAYSLDRLQFFSVSRMMLSFSENSEDSQIIRASVQNNIFYFTQQWHNHRTLSEFCKELSLYLKLSPKSTLLLIELLQEPLESLKEWLEEKGFLSENLPQIINTHGSTMPDETDLITDQLQQTHISINVGNSNEAFINSDTATQKKSQEKNQDVACATPIKQSSQQASGSSSPNKIANQQVPSEENLFSIVLPQETDFSKSRKTEFKSTFFKAPPQPNFDRESNTISNKEIEEMTPNSSEINELTLEESTSTQAHSCMETSIEKSLTSPPKQPCEKNLQAIGRWGESFIEQIFLYKYQQQTQPNGKYAGGIITHNSLGFTLTHPKTTIKIIWKNKSGESGESVDFIIENNQRIKYIEVKTTINNGNTPFVLSGNEFTLAIQKQHNYQIFRVYFAGAENAAYYKIKNPGVLLLKGGLFASSLEIKPGIRTQGLIGPREDQTTQTEFT